MLARRIEDNSGFLPDTLLEVQVHSLHGMALTPCVLCT